MNATIRTCLALALAAFVSPDTLFAAPPHTGQVVHDGFELSDVALFACAAAGLWFARRSMRARAAARRTRPD
ncbi:MAG: hypothetical protein V4537_01070 [Pseudomonadota bacterium]